MARPPQEIKVTLVNEPDPSLLYGLAELIAERVNRQVELRLVKPAGDEEERSVPGQNKGG